jgi:hypothetical protein
MCGLALRHWIGVRISLVKRRKELAQGHSRLGLQYPPARYQYACKYNQCLLTTKRSWDQKHTFLFDQQLCSRRVLSPCAVFFLVDPYPRDEGKSVVRALSAAVSFKVKVSSDSGSRCKGLRFNDIASSS